MNDRNGVRGVPNLSVSATPLAAVAPLNAQVSASSVTLTWSSIAGATAYNIYRCTTPGGEAGNVLVSAWTGNPATGYTDDSVAMNTAYYYKVTGEYGAGLPYSGESTLADCAEAPVTLSPVIATVSASPNPVTGLTTSLSVSATDYSGGPGPTGYTWSQTTGPSSAAFSTNNGTLSANSVTATFSAAGSYTFQVLVADSLGGTATGDVAVTVNQTPTAITVSPDPATVGSGQTQQFTAAATDQFGANMTTQPSLGWSVAAGGVGGTITQAALYTAPSTSGTDTVTASGGGMSGSATVDVEPAISTIVLDAQSASSGYTGTGMVTLAGPSVGASTVGISSDDPSVTVPAGANFAPRSDSASFSYSLAPVRSQTGVTVTGTYYGTAASAYIAVYPAIDLSANATGANKITLFWPTITGAVGYDIYRSVDGGMTYPEVATDTADSDPNPTLSPYDEYSDTGLLTGSPYYYYIAAVNSAGTEFALSGYCTATPSAAAIPWDTGNASAVITAVNAEVSANLVSDSQVGILFALGPDGTMYSGNYPDGTPAHAEQAPAYADWNAGQMVYSDGETEPLPSDANGEPQDLATETLPPSGSPPDSVYKTDYQYPPEKGNSGGPFRKVESQPGFLGLLSVLYLPDPSENTKLAAWQSSGLNLVAPDPNIPSHHDAADIYTGGGVAVVNKNGQFALDSHGNYIERSALDVGLSCGHNGYAWKPLISEKNASVTAVLGSADDNETVDANHPEIEVNWDQPALLVFEAPCFQTVKDGFMLNLAGDITATYKSSSGTVVGEPESFATLFYSMSGKEDGWATGKYDIIKRANSIAQYCSPPNDTYEPDGSWVFNADWGDVDGLTNYNQDALLLENGTWPIWKSISTDHDYCSLDGSYPAPSFTSSGFITYNEVAPVSQESGIEIQTDSGSFQ